jgi:circadian clock protein KaiC
MQSGVEFSLADGILQLAYEPREPVDRRWMRVVKMRGGTHLEGKHTFHISPDGFQVFPRVETILPAASSPFSGRITSGTPGLDKLMGGGIPAGDATLIMGPSGAGKTIFSLAYIAEGLAHGERCLYITFQDTADQLTGMADSFGWDFGKAAAAGQLTIAHVPMGSLDLDVLVSGVREQLSGEPIGRVVIDSLAEMAAAAREAERFPAYLRSLAGLIRAAGASLLITSETTTLGPLKEPIEGLMFLFHNLIQLRYFEHTSRLGRAINILKMRNSRHDDAVYSCHIADSDGLSIGAQLTDVTGILGWSTLTNIPNPVPGTPARAT